MSKSKAFGFDNAATQPANRLRFLVVGTLVNLIAGIGGLCLPTSAAASYDDYCRQSGNGSSSALDCSPARASSWQYIGNIMPWQESFASDGPLSVLIAEITGRILAHGSWCQGPVITAEGAFIETTSNAVLQWRTQLLRTTGYLNSAPTPCSDPAFYIDSTWTAYAESYRTFSCPSDAVGPFMGPGESRYCARHRNMCAKTPHPVAISDGSKYYSRVTDAPALDRFFFYRTYTSHPSASGYGLLNPSKPSSDPETSAGDTVGWQASYDARIWHSSNTAGTNHVVNVDIPGENQRSFLAHGSIFQNLQNDASTLVKDAGGNLIFRNPGLTLWKFGSTGRLLALEQSSGFGVTIDYPSATLRTVTDRFGRMLRLILNEKGVVTQVVLPSNDMYAYQFATAGPLSAVVQPAVGGVTRSRRYVYEDARFIGAVTGEIDELGTRTSTFTYDDKGRVISTVKHLSGGQFTGAYGFDYATPNSTVVTDPLGTARAYGFGWYGSTPLESVSQPGGSGCAAATKNTIVDAQGNPMAVDNFNGTRSCRFHDVQRGLELVRLDGLAQYSTCGGYDSPDVGLPENSRKVNQQWHPDWPLVTKRSEPGRIITNVYNGQPDPFNGNASANCAPTTALLTDGKRIAVLCKRVEQATGDTNGAAGFSAALQTAVPKREWKWTYNEFGQVLTEDGPRTDVADVTTYQYYPTTTADYTKGDLKQVSNALSKLTQYTKYNKHGQVLESKDANLVVTVNEYDLRQRLTSATVGGQKTTYEYDAVGQLKKVILPDNTFVGFDYDDAHRQIAVYDHLNNRTDYVLDNAGNRVAENTKDVGGSLKRQMTRSFDALGRVQKTIGME